MTEPKPWRCSLCTALDVPRLIKNLQPYEKRRRDHQACFSALEASVDRGCDLCRLFYMSLFKDDPVEFTVGGRPSLLRRSSTGLSTRTTSSFVTADSVIDWHRDVDSTSGNAGFVVEMKAESTLSTDFALEYALYYHRGEGTDEASSSPKPRRLVLACDGLNDFNIKTREVGEFPSFSLYSSWLNSCAYGGRHIRCEPDEPVPLPARLIDVGTGSGSNLPKLVNTAGLMGTYLTLSHCWGQTRPLVTTHTNFGQHTQGISFVTLPRMFKDALLVTRLLGQRFIWIDSLCIVQDDPADWEKECARMGDIYRLSLCTIAAPAASESDHSFLSPRSRSQTSSCIVPDGSQTSRMTIGFPSPELKSRRSAIASRAWILQEQLLSPRTLYFGSQGMYFQCKSHECLETHHNALPPERMTSWRTEEASDLPKSLLSMATRDVAYWYSIVRQYSFRGLTYGEDKLPALSGLANLLATHSDDEAGYGDYLAGLWSADLARGLTWVCSIKPVTPISTTSLSAAPTVTLPDTIPDADPEFHLLHTPDALAPSWTWASQAVPVEWRVLKDFRADAECVGIDVKRSESHPFGRVERATLTLTAPVRSALLQRRPNVKGHLLVGLADSREMAELMLDATSASVISHRWRKNDNSLSVRLLRLGQAASSLYGIRWYAMVLVQVVADATSSANIEWRRIGIASSLVPNTAHPRSLSVEQSFGLFDKARRETLVVQ